jgi:hypothetical protein
LIDVLNELQDYPACATALAAAGLRDPQFIQAFQKKLGVSSNERFDLVLNGQTKRLVDMLEVASKSTSKRKLSEACSHSELGDGHVQLKHVGSWFMLGQDLLQLHTTAVDQRCACVVFDDSDESLPGAQIECTAEVPEKAASTSASDAAIPAAEPTAGKPLGNSSDPSAKAAIGKKVSKGQAANENDKKRMRVSSRQQQRQQAHQDALLESARHQNIELILQECMPTEFTQEDDQAVTEDGDSSTRTNWSWVCPEIPSDEPSQDSAVDDFGGAGVISDVSEVHRHSNTKSTLYAETRQFSHAHHDNDGTQGLLHHYLRQTARMALSVDLYSNMLLECEAQEHKLHGQAFAIEAEIQACTGSVLHCAAADNVEIDTELFLAELHLVASKSEEDDISDSQCSQGNARVKRARKNTLLPETQDAASQQGAHRQASTNIMQRLQLAMGLVHSQIRAHHDSSEASVTTDEDMVRLLRLWWTKANLHIACGESTAAETTLENCIEIIDRLRPSAMDGAQGSHPGANRTGNTEYVLYLPHCSDYAFKTVSRSVLNRILLRIQSQNVERAARVAFCHAISVEAERRQQPDYVESEGNSTDFASVMTMLRGRFFAGQTGQPSHVQIVYDEMCQWVSSPSTHEKARKQDSSGAVGALGWQFYSDALAKLRGVRGATGTVISSASDHNTGADTTKHVAASGSTAAPNATTIAPTMDRAASAWPSFEPVFVQPMTSHGLPSTTVIHMIYHCGIFTGETLPCSQMLLRLLSIATNQCNDKHSDPHTVGVSDMMIIALLEMFVLLNRRQQILGAIIQNAVVTATRRAIQLATSGGVDNSADNTKAAAVLASVRILSQSGKGRVIPSPSALFTRALQTARLCDEKGETTIYHCVVGTVVDICRSPSFLHKETKQLLLLALQQLRVLCPLVHGNSTQTLHVDEVKKLLVGLVRAAAVSAMKVNDTAHFAAVSAFVHYRAHLAMCREMVSSEDAQDILELIARTHGYLAERQQCLCQHHEFMFLCVDILQDSNFVSAVVEAGPDAELERRSELAQCYRCMYGVVCSPNKLVNHNVEPVPLNKMSAEVAAAIFALALPNLKDGKLARRDSLVLLDAIHASVKKLGGAALSSSSEMAVCVKHMLTSHAEQYPLVATQGAKLDESLVPCVNLPYNQPACCATEVQHSGDEGQWDNLAVVVADTVVDLQEVECEQIAHREGIEIAKEIHFSELHSAADPSEATVVQSNTGVSVQADQSSSVLVVCKDLYFLLAMNRPTPKIDFASYEEEQRALIDLFLQDLSRTPGRIESWFNLGLCHRHLLNLHLDQHPCSDSALASMLKKGKVSEMAAAGASPFQEPQARADGARHTPLSARTPTSSGPSSRTFQVEAKVTTLRRKSERCFEIAIALCDHCLKEMNAMDLEIKSRLAPTGWALNDAVVARFSRDSKWYPGVINKVNDGGTFDVFYDDDEMEKGVLPEHISDKAMDVEEMDEKSALLLGCYEQLGAIICDMVQTLPSGSTEHELLCNKARTIFMQAKELSDQKGGPHKEKVWLFHYMLGIVSDQRQIEASHAREMMFHYMRADQLAPAERSLSPFYRLHAARLKLLLRSVHNTTLDSQADFLDAIESNMYAQEHRCKKCGCSDTKQSEMVLCDGCNAGYHMNCLEPPLLQVPSDDWFCPASGCQARAATELSGKVAMQPSVSNASTVQVQTIGLGHNHMLPESSPENDKVCFHLDIELDKVDGHFGVSFGVTQTEGGGSVIRVQKFTDCACDLNPAQHAGLLVGDELIAINGLPTNTLPHQTFDELLQRDDRLVLRIRRSLAPEQLALRHRRWELFINCMAALQSVRERDHLHHRAIFTFATTLKAGYPMFIEYSQLPTSDERMQSIKQREIKRIWPGVESKVCPMAKLRARFAQKEQWGAQAAKAELEVMFQRKVEVVAVWKQEVAHTLDEMQDQRQRKYDSLRAKYAAAFLQLIEETADRESAIKLHEKLQREKDESPVIGQMMVVVVQLRLNFMELDIAASGTPYRKLLENAYMLYIECQERPALKRRLKTTNSFYDRLQHDWQRLQEHAGRILDSIRRLCGSESIGSTLLELLQYCHREFPRLHGKGKLAKAKLKLKSVQSPKSTPTPTATTPTPQDS